jgi:hypothetical protein
MNRKRKSVIGAVCVLALVAAGIVAYRAQFENSEDPSAPTVTARSDAPNVHFTVAALPEQALDDSVASYATPLGTPYEITPSAPAAGSTVSFPIDPQVDLAEIGGYQPSPSNLFIAIYEPGLRMWVPLASHYDSSAQTLSAVAPHFSSLRKMIVNGTKEVGAAVAGGAKTVLNAATGAYEVAKDEVTGLMELTQQFYDGISKGVSLVIAAASDPHQEPADCGKADPSYSITVSQQADKFPACVTSASETVLAMENHFLIPYGFKPPPGAAPRTPFSTYTSLVDFIAGVYYKGLNGMYLPAHGAGELVVGDSLRGAHQWTGTLVMDTFAFAMAASLGALAVVPGFKWETEELTLTLRQTLTQVASKDGVVDIRTFFLELEKTVTEESNKPEQLENLGNLNDLVGCIQKLGPRLEEAFTTGTVEERMQSVLEGARDCAAATIQGLSKVVDSTAASTLAGLTDLVVVTRGIWQAAFAGPQAASIPVVVTYSPPMTTTQTAAPTWLYQSFLHTTAIGPSGIQRAATIDGRNYPNSTSFWVGCEGLPAVTQFSLDGKYSLVNTTLGLDSGTPQSLSVTITLAADGVPLETWTLRPGQSVPVSGSVAGRMVLSLSAQAVSGTCGSSAVGYGIAGDARLS